MNQFNLNSENHDQKQLKNNKITEKYNSGFSHTDIHMRSKYCTPSSGHKLNQARFNNIITQQTKVVLNLQEQHITTNIKQELCALQDKNMANTRSDISQT